ncbi:MAG: YfbM family protein [Blastocatellia bacterium]
MKEDFMGMVCGLTAVDEGQINEFLTHRENVFDYLDELEENEEIGGVDLDKAWHGIHFLLTRSAWDGAEPLCYLVKGGEEIGAEDDCARLLRPNQIADWANALSTISSDDLRKRYDPAAMTKTDIYPEIWDRAEEEQGNLEYLLDYLRNPPFISRANEKRE